MVVPTVERFDRQAASISSGGGTSIHPTLTGLRQLLLGITQFIS